MSLENIIALFLFAGVLVCTPGPANILLFSSGAKFGWQASLPLLIGVLLGAVFLHLSLALGLWKIIQAYPQILGIMKLVGFCYILWLAYKILAISIKKNDKVKALSFCSGLIIHPANPKAWVMIISAYGQFIELKSSWWWQTIIITFVFLAWQMVGHSSWCFFGEKIFQKFTRSNRKKEKIFLWILAILMVSASLWAILN